MLTDDDIIRLTTAFSKVFITKDDLASMEGRLINKIKKNTQEIQKNRKEITKNRKEISKNREAIDKNYEEISRNRTSILRVDGKVTTLADEVVEYTKAHFDAHQKDLDNHSDRIQNLEHFHT